MKYDGSIYMMSIHKDTSYAIEQTSGDFLTLFHAIFGCKRSN